MQVRQHTSWWLAFELPALQSPANFHAPRNMWLGPSAKSALTFTGVVRGNPLLGWSSRGTGTSGLPEAPPLIFLIEAHWHKAARSPLPTLAPQPGLLYFQNSNSPLKEETHVREKTGHTEPRASFWLNLPESASTLTWKIALELNPKVFLSLTLSGQKNKIQLSHVNYACRSEQASGQENSMSFKYT